MEEAVAQTTHGRCTLPEYFELAEKSDDKLEFHDGEIIPMPGGTETHSLITANVISELQSRLKDKPCRVYDSNLRVTPAAKKKYYYPDVLISQNSPSVQTYFRQPDGTWSFSFAEGKEAIARLRSLEIDLPLSEVYAKVDLPAAVE